MFNIQKFPQSLEIYINYNEYLVEDEDESIPILEHMISDNRGELKGIIDLITAKNLSKKEMKIIRGIHDLLRNNDIKELNVISDNKKLLERIKGMFPDVSVTFFSIY